MGSHKLLVGEGSAGYREFVLAFDNWIDSATEAGIGGRDRTAPNDRSCAAGDGSSVAAARYTKSAA